MKVLDHSDSKRLRIVHTVFKPFLDVAPRYFNEKKLSFCVPLEDESPPTFRDRPSKSSGITEGDNSVFYHYVSSCAEAPPMPSSKKTFA